jgi:hypothetical protein
MTMDNDKTFGTVLQDHPQVSFLKNTYHKIVHPDIELPKNFDGRLVWRNYLTPIRYQGYCGNCWAIATVTSFSDRLAIITNNENNTQLSSLNMTVCSDVIAPKPYYDPDIISQTNFIKHGEGACFGNTIYNALRFLHVYGALELFCSSKASLQTRGYKYVNDYVTIRDVPNCQSLFGNDFDQCILKGVAARYFRTKGHYTVANDVEQIKREIYQFGPVVSGFIIYDDFMNNYDGLSIYMGPSKDSKPSGGHAVRIVGWGEEVVNGENVSYWIIANSWGESWGLGGFFKMRMNISECELEKNVCAMIPDIPELILPDYVNFVNIEEDEEKRAQFNVNPSTGYLSGTEEKIKKGLLKGQELPIYDKNKLIDFSTVYAAEILPYTRLFQSKAFISISETNKSIVTYKNAFIIWLLLIIIFFGVIFYKKFRK